MELSKRLRAVAELVESGNTLADIGTDHAYIPIYLVGRGRISSAVAMDVNRGPLKRAEENIWESGYADKITVRLSDGFGALREGEAQSAVISGMGGSLMIRILRDGEQAVRSLKECILQPQSDIEKVRTFLTGEGFSFIQEDMVEEDGKYYPMMKVKPPSGTAGQDEGFAEDWSVTELRYGRLLLRDRHPVLREYLEREMRLYREILERLGRAGSRKDTERTEMRRRELVSRLKCAEKGMEYYAVQRDCSGDRGCLPEGGGS